MRRFGGKAAIWMSGLSVLISACGGGGSSSTTTTTPPTTYVLTVNSQSPSSGVAIGVAPADTNGATQGTTSFTRTYNAGTTVTLTAPTASGSNPFSSWTGCSSASTVTCTVTMNAAATVTANYSGPKITSVTVTPNPETAIIGSQVQFVATVAGTGSIVTTVTWSVAAPSGSSLSAGTIDVNGLYTTPYPAPATVTVTATSTEDTTQSGSATVTLSPPATASGPALSVDATTQGRPAISPYIYGMNEWLLDAAQIKATNITIDRWGGDATSRYNYLLDVTNSASDWWFENQLGATGQKDTSEFNALVASNASLGVKTLGTVPVLGWASKDSTSCGFSVAKYGAQQKTAPDRTDCGNGVLLNGSNVVSDPTDTSIPVNPSWVGNWAAYLKGKFGPGGANNGVTGVAIYDLDNEPAWWDAVHRDVHPVASTYDEVTNNGIATAKAIKTADSTAEVSGPVVDYWWNYFYSKKDVESGWGSGGGPCWEPWSNPVDRKAHGGIPFIEYYLQQFAAASATYGSRLLDYVDLHTYDAASYNGTSVGLNPAGDTGAQEARLNSTRAFWDPTYTDPNIAQPNYLTDPNYTSSCTTPLQAPQLIPMMRNWVAKDYPGTKLAITEYNWGGMESINGALAEADILGIFGREGLDLGTMWPTTDPATQIPGLMAFEIYRNYDGKNSTFGDISLVSTTADQGKLSVYSALRSADNAITVVVVNKTYGDLTTSLSLANVTVAAGTSAQAFLYSNASLKSIVAQPAVPVTPPATGSATSTLSATFPAQSITLLVVPD
jgi:hypothetical protein